jgi:hypothetical protein
MKTQVLNLKKPKTQIPIGYLAHNFMREMINRDFDYVVDNNRLKCS